MTDIYKAHVGISYSVGNTRQQGEFEDNSAFP